MNLAMSKNIIYIFLLTKAQQVLNSFSDINQRTSKQKSVENVFANVSLVINLFVEH